VPRRAEVNPFSSRAGSTADADRRLRHRLISPDPCTSSPPLRPQFLDHSPLCIRPTAATQDSTMGEAVPMRGGNRGVPWSPPGPSFATLNEEHLLGGCDGDVQWSATGPPLRRRRLPSCLFDATVPQLIDIGIRRYST
jgi:hypothetical protein